MDFRALMSLCLVSVASANQLYYLQPSLSSPERFPGLGLTPRYHALVYDYINGMAGHQPPAHVRYAAFPARVEDFGANGEPALADVGAREPVTEGPADGAPAQPSHLLPSDFILLTRSPQSQFFGNFDAIKNKRMKLGVEKSALPPIGGVVSNYVLQRQVNDKVKRQAYAYSNDGSDEEGVVTNASSEPRAEDNSSSTNSTSDSKDNEPQPSVAQSKPQAVALAGVGGVAQAAPVATAVVGKDGLAIAAPSATAIAGQGAQGALQIAGEEKMKKRTSVSVVPKLADRNE